MIGLARMVERNRRSERCPSARARLTEGASEQEKSNRLEIALQVREAMRRHRAGKPIAFQSHQYPPRARPAAPVSAWKELT